VSITAAIALFGWIPVVLGLFALLPAQRAMVAGAIGAWLLLPPTGIDLPGLPTYDKTVAATVGILLATIIFEPNRLMAFRPRWFDLPILLWCVCPFCSSVSNNLGAYDGLSASFRAVVAWLFPYLVGRLYLTDLASMRDLALGMVIGGVCLIPLCLLECRISQRLMPIVYGMDRWEGTRGGGYRPRVFFSTSLELGLWMNAVTLVAIWLWRTGQLKRLGRLPGGVVAAALTMTAVIFCKCTGATMLLFLGLCSLWGSWRTRTKWAMWALLSVAPIYYALRTTDTWSGRHAVELARSLFGNERAWSLQFRFLNENVFIAKALQRPIFGWADWGRIYVYDGNGTPLTIPDQLAVIAFSSRGYVGLVAVTAILLLPPALFLRRFAVKQWGHADLAPSVAIAVVLNLYLLDCLVNGLFNALYIIAAGGMLTIVGVRPKAQLAHHDGSKRGQPGDVPSHLPAAGAASEISTYPRKTAVELGAGLPDPQGSLALRYQTLGRDLKMQGRLAEAKAIWIHALDLWTELATTCPDRPLLHQHWCDCANDLAWLLANAPDQAVRDPAHAIVLGGKAAEVNPNCATYWNTLGVAHYRAGDFSSAIATLSRAMDLTEGGTAFDHVFLAMAHAQLGDQEQAEHWLDRARLWMEQCNQDHSELTCLCDEACYVLSTALDSSVTLQ
jgi:tetratricopeptide (TPR) repeat protein